MNTVKKKIPNILIVITVIIISEIMFFSGIVSAYLIAAAKAGNWPPASQPRLPIYISFINMLVLLTSGVAMYFFIKNLSKNIINKTLIYLSLALALIFLIIQGKEWINLINFGAQNSDGLYASYFYSIIALHGVHVIFGVLLLIYLLFQWSKNKFYSINNSKAISYFWFFVCLLWPILFFMIYLY